ncbi:flagellar basal body-associated FliL family protein [Aquibacillus salsiterrae]|uniref:Flagellar protein FliL n=1 Tax=Aquibacillus salsiterrae TaxID=2950439 RepID=A0A9X3WBB2_9BACI|nr:flagellar basal body-associated FliL family protein [Aquibacillus salsiterrae]MDC3416387.1 flagellar basal body-associated protein FliL [Aquibacillus salsiterrae]
MNPKLLKLLVTLLVIITISGIVAVVIVLNLSGEAKGAEEQTLDKMVENSFTSSEMSTDLKDGSFVRIQFQLITNSKDAKQEVEKREFQLKNLFIKESVQLTSEDFKVGLSTLEEKLKDEMNQLMEDGEIVDVYIINKILQ